MHCDFRKGGRVMQNSILAIFTVFTNTAQNSFNVKFFDNHERIIF